MTISGKFPSQRPEDAPALARGHEVPIPGPLLAAIVLLGLSSRVLLALYGDPYDVEAWSKAAAAIERGNLYANTDAYNYGPIWGYILFGLHRIAGAFGPDTVTTLHVAATIFLSVVDAINASILRSLRGIGVALIYYLCPVTILLAGYYCQFYTLGLLPGLIAFALFEDAGDRVGWGRILAIASLLGLSLATKHFLIFYPLWLALDRKVAGMGRRLALVVVPYVVFLGSFAPFLGDPSAAAAIRRNVFQFESHGLHALMPQVLELFIPPVILARIYASLDWVPVFHGVKLAWALLMTFTGWRVMRLYPRDSIFFYLAAMVAFTPMMIEIYLVIPVAGCAALWRYPAARVYVAVASVLLFLNFSGRASVPDPVLSAVNRWASWRVENADMVRAQVWVLVLLITALWRVPGEPGTDPGEGSSQALPPG